MCCSRWKLSTQKTWHRWGVERGRVADENLENVQRWTAKQRTTLVLQVVKEVFSGQEAARKHGLTLVQVEDWLEKGLAGMGYQLRSRPRDDEPLKDEEIERRKQKVGELVLDNDILQELAKPYRPERTSDE